VNQRNDAGSRHRVELPHLFFDSAIHALKHPHNPAAFDDLPDEAECPLVRSTHALLLRLDGEEVLEEPFCDKQETEVVLLCDFWALGLDILE